MSVAHGHCLCGAVRFRVEPAPTRLWFCHCGQCRRAQGTAFAASVPVSAADFTLEAGADRLRAYRATPAKARWFCGDCGSPVYSAVDGVDTLRVRAGLFDPALPLTPVAHIFTADRATWFDIRDDLPQHPAREPGR